MFKRIVFFCLMFIASLGCIAQDHLYITPVSSSKFELGDVSNVYGMTIDMQIYREITHRSWTRLCYGMGFRSVDGDFEPIIGVSFGVGIDFGNFYGILDLMPTIKCIGNGHQVYGDEFAFRLMPKVGIGYNWFISHCTALFVETGFYKEFDVIYTRNDLNVNSFGIYLNIGFRFQHI